jgi:hypothetical protein
LQLAELCSLPRMDLGRQPLFKSCGHNTVMAAASQRSACMACCCCHHFSAPVTTCTLQAQDNSLWAHGLRNTKSTTSAESTGGSAPDPVRINQQAVLRALQLTPQQERAILGGRLAPGCLSVSRRSVGSWRQNRMVPVLPSQKRGWPACKPAG